MHAAFKLPRSKTRDLNCLSDSEVNMFRVVYRDLKCTIFDEVSMLSADNFDTIECRL